MFRRGLLMALVGLIVSGGLAVTVVAPAQAAPPSYAVASQVTLPVAGEGIAVDPARGLVYVANRAAGMVLVLDEATMSVQATIPVPSEPYRLAVGSTGLIYVSQYAGNFLPGFVSVIDPLTRTVVSTVPVGDSPVGVTISADGSLLYVANLSSPFLSVLSLADPVAPVALAPIPLPGGSETVTENPAGTLLYVAAQSDNVYVVDVATGALVTTWTGQPAVHQVAISADGTHGFVSQQQGATAPIFDLATNTQSGAIPIANSYYQSSDPSQGAGFITQPFASGGSVTVIDNTTGAITQTVTGVTGAFTIATDATTHLTFVTQIANNTLTKIALAPPVVTTDPADQTVNIGETATFTATATGATPLTVQWQRSTNGGASWADVPGAASTTFTTGATMLSDSGSQFRAVFTDLGGSTATAAATLLVNPPPLHVTLQPVDQTVTEGTTATFTTAATGPLPFTVRWQVSTDGGVTWTGVPGATSDTLTIASATIAQSGTQYRAVFTNPTGSVTTTAATLTVTAAGGTTPPAAPPVTGPTVNTGGVSGAGPATPAGGPLLIALGFGAVAAIAVAAVAGAIRRRRA